MPMFPHINTAEAPHWFKVTMLTLTILYATIMLGGSVFLLYRDSRK